MAPKFQKRQKENDQISESKQWWIVLGVIVALSLYSRLYNITEPRKICWDETHFGKHGSFYINRKFFFDVHPPLGKMMIGLFGLMTGYNGSFSFEKPGMEYEDTKYEGMRVMCALFGACLVPLAYGIVWELTHSLVAAILGASFILLDTGTNTLSRYILLDPLLLFFIVSSPYCYLKFNSLKDRSFSIKWWVWLGLTGFNLACAFSVKFVGLFIIVVIGLNTIRDLWDLLGDLAISIPLLIRHFLARALLLILLPVVVYTFFFWIHLTVLNQSGGGDGFYSSSFQSQLLGNPLNNASLPGEVAYGSTITLKNSRVGGAYLHSHWHLYPENMGARQQQVTCYSHKDDNNLWLIKKAYEEPSKHGLEFVRNGDWVRLEHVPTGRNLHSHKEKAPYTIRHFQVTCYGQNGTGDANDFWKVIIIKGQEKEKIKTVKTTFMLKHVNKDCALTQTEKKLPKWGWEQHEVSCNPHSVDDKSYWNVEFVKDERLPNVPFTMYAPGFVEKLIESHRVMLKGNSGLKPKEGEVTSQPWQWPINHSGQLFSGGKYRIYLLGNPILFWGNLVWTGVFLVIFVYEAVKRQRGSPDTPKLRAYKDKNLSSCLWLLLVWGVHYVPFWTMGRVLYFHHYFPAYQFHAMFSAIVIDYSLNMLSKCFPKNSATVYHIGLGLVASVTVYSFYLFHPLTYGMGGILAIDKNSTMYGLKWMDTWDI